MATIFIFLFHHLFRSGAFNLNYFYARKCAQKSFKFSKVSAFSITCGPNFNYILLKKFNEIL